MKIVAVVPIKMNSVRLPQKNIKVFKEGEPLCTYILRTLLNIKYIDEVYVYCSDERIVKYLPEGVLYIKRSKQLDLDSTRINDVLEAFAKDVYADIYVMTHTTAPFISSNSIETGISAILYEGYDSALAVRKMQDFFWKNYKPFNYELENIPRTQDIEPLYCETSGFYIYRRETIYNHHRRIGDKPKLIEVSEIESVDIDEEEDFEIAEAIFLYLRRYCHD